MNRSNLGAEQKLHLKEFVSRFDQSLKVMSYPLIQSLKWNLIIFWRIIRQKRGSFA